MIWEKEEGAVAVIVALLLTVLLMMSALVIDLGALRADAAANQSAADMAAAAAAQEYVSFTEGSLEEACREALAFAGKNLGVEFSGDVCEGFPAVCSAGGSAITVEATAGLYTVNVRNPVPDDDPLMDSPRTDDSTPCQRIAVTVHRSRDFLFARAAGAGDSGETMRGAVSRSMGGEFEAASLIILRPEGTNNQTCRVLRTTGGNVTIEVLRGLNDEPGIITVDSRSNGCADSGSPLLNPSSASGADDPAFVAADRIFSNALRFGDSGVNATHPAIVPQPVLPGPPVTRFNIDHRYNCMETYPDGPDWSPNSWYPQFTMYPDGNVGGTCDSGEEHTSSSPYLSQLHAGAFDEGAVPDGGADPVWGVIDDCSTAETFGPAAEHAGGDGRHFYVDCNEFSPDGGFVDARHVVIRGRHNGGLSRGSFTNPTNGLGTVVVVRNGGVDQDGPLVFEDTFLYLGGTDGVVDIGGGHSVVWAGMETDALDDCQTDVLPTAACFAPLSLWANQDAPRNAPFIVRGNATGEVVGTFFTPNAVVEFRGMDGVPKIEFHGSQFFAQVLQGRGGGSVELRPDASTMVDTTPFGRGLIR